MRTKALLSVAAVLAAGAMVAQAQVYSVNIVGYVNQTNTGGAFNLIQNPLDDGAGNVISNVLAGATGGTEAFIWNGSGYDFASVGAKTGLWSPAVSVPPGTGFFFKPAATYVATYVGEVVAAPGDSVTNALAGGVFDLTGSLLPIATTSVATDTDYGLVGAPAGTEAFSWNGSGYNFQSVGAKTGVWAPDFGIEVGEAIFLKPSAPFDWVQTLPAN